MSRHKGMLSNATIDEKWPHQVSLPNSRTSAEHPAILEFCKGRDRSPLGHTYVEDGQYHNVFCFRDEGDAEAFAARFDGKIIDPKTRPRWPGKPRRRARQ